MTPAEQQVVDEIRTELDGRPVSEPSRTLAQALVLAQAEMPAVEPDAVNPHFRSKFVSLDHLIAKTRPVLNRHGLALTQWPTYGYNGGPDAIPMLKTVIAHATSGQTMEATMPLLVGKQDMQGLGAAITYARRYAWAAACGIASETDDDGESIAAHAQTTRQNTPQETRGSAQTASAPRNGPAPAGNGTTAPAASKQQLGFISGLMGELAEAGVADKDDLKAYARKEYGVAELENLSGGRNGQASELISRLQVRLAGHLLGQLDEETVAALLSEHGGSLDLGQVEAGALAGLIAAAKKAGQA